MIYLKAADEATFNQALIDAGWTIDVEIPPTEEGGDVTTETKVQYYTSTHSLDVIGIIHKETGNMLTSNPDEEGNTFEYPEMAPIDGYHANLRLHGEEMPESLVEFIIDTPATPYRKFA